MKVVDAPSNTGPVFAVTLNVGGRTSKIVTLAMSVVPSDATDAPCASDMTKLTFSPASSETMSFFIVVDSMALMD